MVLSSMKNGPMISSCNIPNQTKPSHQDLVEQLALTGGGYLRTNKSHNACSCDHLPIITVLLHHKNIRFLKIHFNFVKMAAMVVKHYSETKWSRPPFCFSHYF